MRSFSNESSRYAAFAPPLCIIALLTSAWMAWLLQAPHISTLLLQLIITVGTVVTGLQLIRDLARKHAGVDIIAFLAMLTSLLMHEWLAGAVIVLMLAGGEALEQYATARAKKHLSELASDAPRFAHRKHGRVLEDIALEAIRVNDILVVKPGETIPTDAMVVNGSSTVDESRLTGEPIAVDKHASDHVIGGSINQSGLLEIRALVAASHSQYQQIVHLLAEAEQQRAPFVRLADRYSLVFTAITLAFAAIAWAVSHDPLRVLAVLVVATPCPLILATPIALMTGMSRSAKRGVVVRSGSALETLSRIQACVFDKTGTLTFGTPSIRTIHALDGNNERVLHLAASLDQGSSHILAQSLIAAAQAKHLDLDYPKAFQETIGKGVRGTLKGTTYFFGRASFLEEHGHTLSPQLVSADEKRKQRGERTVYLATKTAVIGYITFTDTLRPGLKTFFQQLRRAGVSHVALLTGDKTAIAKRLAASVGIRSVRGECLPQDKLREINALKRFGAVAMIGDGVNDAPALASADVGIAMGAHGSALAAASADVIIMVDDVTRVLDAYRIARSTMATAKQGIFIGIGASTLLMAIAVGGHIVPVIGALLQEGIDIFVILYALGWWRRDAV